MQSTEIIKLQDKNLVTKSNLFTSASYKLNLIEEKVIIAIASVIHPDDTDFHTYTLSVKDFYNFVGYNGTPKYTELRKITASLMRKVNEIVIGNKVVQVAWLSYAAYNKNEGTIDLRFDPFWKPYLLQLKREFTSYRLGNVARMNSTYSIRLYELLKERQRYQQREFSIEKLREHFALEDNQYPAYGNLKQRIINPSIKEINNKTDITVSLEEFKKGRRVVKVRFNITKNVANTVQLGLFDEDPPPVVESKIRYELRKIKVELEDSIIKAWELEYGEDKVIEVIKEVQAKGKDIKHPEKYLLSIFQKPLDEKQEQEKKKKSLPKIEQALYDLYHNNRNIVKPPITSLVEIDFENICKTYDIEYRDIYKYWKDNKDNIMDNLLEIMKNNRNSKRNR